MHAEVMFQRHRAVTQSNIEDALEPSAAKPVAVVRLVRCRDECTLGQCCQRSRALVLVECCIWCILACKAEQRKLPKRGTIRRARFVGARRVTRRWRPTKRHAWCRRGGRVALLLLFCVVGSYVKPHVFCTYISHQCPQLAWAISRKKRNRQMHAKNGNPTYQPKKRKVERVPNTARMDVESSQEELQHGVAAASQREQRVQDNIIQIPGDGWCFFHAVGRYCTQATTWSTSYAAEIYLQALEWLLDARAGPRADEVLIACTPESEAELNKHRKFICARSPGVDTTAWTDTDVVLWSKLLANLREAMHARFNTPWLGGLKFGP